MPRMPGAVRRTEVTRGRVGCRLEPVGDTVRSGSWVPDGSGRSSRGGVLTERGTNSRQKRLSPSEKRVLETRLTGMFENVPAEGLCPACGLRGPIEWDGANVKAMCRDPWHREHPPP